jgi:hypothetical protein
MMNRKMPIHNTSGLKGVTWDKQMKKWRVQTKINDKYKFIGLFNDLAEAGNEYDKFVLINFGEFSRCNN